MELFRGYIETRSKKPLVPFKNKTSDQLLTETQASGLNEYAGILGDNTILVDVDDYEESEILFDIVDALQLNCRVYKTSRGKHFLFKNTDSLNYNPIHKRIALGLTVDIKCGSKCSYSILKYAGKEREILYDIFEDEEYEEVPRWLLPLSGAVPDFRSMSAGDGRNQALFTYILTLQSNDYSKEEAQNVLKLINKYVLPDPLEESELDTIMRDEAFSKPIFFKNKQFLFDVFAKYLKTECNIVKINNNLYIYKDGVYCEGADYIESRMIQIIPTLSDRQRKETLKYLNIYITKNIKLSDANYIAFENGVYNIVDGSFRDFSPEIVVTNKIPHKYDPEAYNELCDRTLNKLACQDSNIRALLEEMIGYTFYRRNELRKCFILTGEKRNGKSTFLDLINAMLGDENISALDIKELNKQFKTAELVNKLANIGDDISDDFIPDGAIFKKLVSGNRVNVERKNANPFDFSNYAKLIFSANKIPKMKDRTGAILDRMIIIPFNAEFKETDDDYDPYIKYKLMTEEVMSYLINIGILGLKRVLEARKFTESTKVDAELKEYEENNNPVLTFFNEIDEEDVLNNSNKDVYAKYKGYCYANGLQAISNIEFSRQVIKHYDFDLKYKKIDGKTCRIFVRK